VSAAELESQHRLLQTDHLLHPHHFGQDQETLMMGSSAHGGRQVEEEMKVPTRKEQESLLRRYAKKLGLNTRGCYVAVALSILILFLIIVIIAMAACWPASHLRYSGALDVCLTPACLSSAASVVASVNSSISVCNDPWAFSCHGWQRRNPLPDTRSEWSVLLQLEQESLEEQARLLGTFAQEPSQYNSIEWKVQHFYESCKSLDYIASDREKPLMKIINNLGGWDVLRSFNLYNWDPHRVLRELHSEFGVSAFFEVSVVPDPRAPGRNIVRVSPSGLGLPDRTYYTRFPNDSAVQAYQTFMKDSAQLFGSPSPEAHKFAVDIFNFEKRIAEITPGQDYLADPLKINNKMKVRELRTMSINVPWLEVLKACYPNAQMSEDTEVLVVSPQYNADIAVIMSTTDRGSLNNYLIWRLVHSYMPFLSRQFTEVVHLYRKLLTGARKPPPRWQFCAGITHKFFAHLLDSLLHREQILELGTRESEVQRIFAGLRQAVSSKVSSSNAFDFHSRQAALDKLNNMKVQVGTPDILQDRKFLKIMYKDFQVQKTDFFQNILYGMTFARKREEHALVSPGEETRWLPALLLSEVTYVASANRVVIPEYLLQPPVFHPANPVNLNLGGLGVMLARAIVDGVAGHGAVFTAAGRLLGGSGQGSNYTLGRGALSGHVLETPSNCLMEAWGSASLDTPDMLGRSRKDSALGLASLETVLAAFASFLAVDGASLLPALEHLDPQAVLLLQHARLQCEVQSLEARDLARTTRTRLLARERMVGEFSQLPDFSHFFFCAEPEGAQCGPVL